MATLLPALRRPINAGIILIRSSRGPACCASVRARSYGRLIDEGKGHREWESAGKKRSGEKRREKERRAELLDPELVALSSEREKLEICGLLTGISRATAGYRRPCRGSLPPAPAPPIRARKKESLTSSDNLASRDSPRRQATHRPFPRYRNADFHDFRRGGDGTIFFGCLGKKRRQTRGHTPEQKIPFRNFINPLQSNWTRCSFTFQKCNRS